MIRRPISLVITFSVMFAVLIGIQVYFLKNSYALKKREIFSVVKKQLNNLEDDVDIFDDDLVRDDDAMKSFIALEKGDINESDLSNIYAEKSAIVKPHLKKYVDSAFKSLGYQVNVHKEFSSIYSHHANKQLIKKPITIYQTAAELKNREILSTGKWETSTKSESTENNAGIEKVMELIKYTYTIRRITFFEISNLKMILFKELFILMSISVLILIAILFLFYRSYQNLLKQRKQINLLHDMVDNVSHEFKTPIATLKVISKTLIKKEDSDVVRILDRQVNRLEALLNPILENENIPNRGEYQLNDLLPFLEDFKFSNPSIKIELDSIPNSKLAIHKQDLETIISNLLSNSVKYGATQIQIRFDQIEGFQKISIADNGIGIDKKEQAFIFEKYYRIQRENIHNTKGLGIGLYIVSKILTQNKGKIVVQSQPEEGSIFQIILPYAW